MAVRLVNVHRQPLRIDLRGGDVLVLNAGARSGPLREELLYDNHHLPEWERKGWIVRVPAKMQEVLDAEAVPEQPKTEKAVKAHKPGKTEGAGKAAKTEKTKKAAREKAPRERK